MRHLLDTSTIVAALRRRTRAVVLPRIRARPPGDAVTSAVVAYELYVGAARSDRPEENRRELEALLEDLGPLPFTREDAAAAAAVRVALGAKGTLIGPYDVLIAGQALARGLVLVTNNVREFARVQGLAVEDWS